MKRRIIYSTLVVLLVTLNIVGTHIYVHAAQVKDKDSAYPSLELFSYVLEKVRKDYVDGKNLTYQQLVYGALKGMINTLDPHSEFMEPFKYDELQKDTQGSFGGLGITIEMKDNYVTVLAPMEDTPGFKAGIMSGDRIIKIDGKSADKLGLTDAVQHLRGEPGTEVTVTVMRPSTGKVMDLKMTRAIIKMDMVKDVNSKKEFPLGDDKIGYVRLLQFGEKTSDELEKALKKLKGQGMQALIIDLRWNPGGLLDQAVDVCEKFLPKGQLVVSTEGQNTSQDSKRYANGHGDELGGMPIVILVNGQSASASEIVAGCLQDLKRAEIMGEKTFGKGSVQSIIPLQDGSALRLTTAKYYTPSHRVIHGEGITPDSVVPMTDEEYQMVYMKTRPGLEILSEKERDEIKNAHDLQLDRAHDLLKGILIYTHRSNGNEKIAGKGEKKVVSIGEPESAVK
jgi:carboxyl-terminal processing protease